MNYNLIQATNDKPTSTSTPLKFEHNYLIQNNNVFIEPDKMTHIEMNETQQKSNRKFLGNNAVAILLKWFHSNKDYPYPDEATTDRLAKEANISCKQVKKWFANKRVRSQMCCKPNRQRKRTAAVNQSIEDEDKQSPQEFNLTSQQVSTFSHSNNGTPKTPINRNIYQNMTTTTMPLIHTNKSVPLQPPNMMRNGLYPNIMQLMAFYNPLLMMNAVLASSSASSSSSSSSLDHNNNQNITNKTTTTTTPSPTSSSSVSPYSSVSPSSSINSSTNTQNTPNTKLYATDSNKNDKKFENKKINFAVIASLID